jgi:hypothetical protein
VTLWDLTVTLLLVLIELAVLTVIAAPRWVARQLRALLDRVFGPIVRPLATLRAGIQNAPGRGRRAGERGSGVERVGARALGGSLYRSFHVFGPMSASRIATLSRCETERFR